MGVTCIPNSRVLLYWDKVSLWLHLLRNPCQPQTCDPPNSASHMLELHVCVITHFFHEMPHSLCSLGRTLALLPLTPKYQYYLVLNDFLTKRFQLETLSCSWDAVKLGLQYFSPMCLSKKIQVVLSLSSLDSVMSRMFREGQQERIHVLFNTSA